MGKGTMRSGFVCISGPTNAGKSTLMNALVGQKLAIITPKPQTTRNRIMGIHTVGGKGQIVFVDTPGFHRAENALGKRMNRVAVRSLLDTDLALLVVDVTLDLSRGEGAISPRNLNAVKQVEASGLPVVVALNKVDKVPRKELLLPLLAAYEECMSPAAMVPLSARKSDGLKQLESHLFELLPEGDRLYPEDMISDQPERFLAAEIIREKLIMVTKEELPYSTAVQIESWKEVENRKGDVVVHLSGIIHVERESQKGIVIGKGGLRLKEVGERARLELERMLENRVYLKLFVRVEKNWSGDPRRLDKLGYREE